MCCNVCSSVCYSEELLCDKGGFQIIEVVAVCVAVCAAVYVAACVAACVAVCVAIYVAVCVEACVAVCIVVCVAVGSCCVTKEASKLSR